MILTEEEAKTKSCQESFGDTAVSQSGHYVAGPAAPGVYAGGTVAIGTSPSHCIGSACMAWRWYPQCEAHIKVEGQKGYCGKAGKP